MRRYILFIALFPLLAHSQSGIKGVFLNDAPIKELSNIDSIKNNPKLFMWNVHPDNFDMYPVTPDTLQKGFKNYNPIFERSIANNYTGNYGSPYQSMIYFDRILNPTFIFQDVYDAYMYKPKAFNNTNTKVPYTNITWTNGGPKTQAEESLYVFLSRNVNKDFNLTGFGNMLYGRGLYRKSSTRHVNFSFNSSYVKPRYQLYTNVGVNDMANFENGGITDPEYIENPNPDDQQVRFSEDIPTQFSGDNQSKYYYFGANIKQRYNIGFKREVELEDTIIDEFVPVTGLIHEFNYSNNIKKYLESANESYYNYPDTNIIRSDGAHDRYQMHNFENRFGIYYNEGVNKYTPFGLGAYIKHEFVTIKNNPWYSFNNVIANSSYTEAKAELSALTMDSIGFHKAKNYTNDTYTNLSLGGSIFKRKGNNFFFDLNGDFVFAGFKVGDYLLKGDVDLKFNVLDTAYFNASAEFSGQTVDYMFTKYISNYFSWNNNFKKINRQRIKSSLGWDKYDVSLGMSLENIFNYVYFNNQGLPIQTDNILQVLAINADKNFTRGPFHWDNKLVYQTSSHQNIIPLPVIALNSDLYYQNKNRFWGVLSTQLGVQARYHSAYYALNYMPATGRFHTQNSFEVGNYPMLDVYANLQIKRMRIFVMYQHVNYELAIRNYWSSPYYANNPRMLKLGISWNFYD